MNLIRSLFDRKTSRRLSINLAPIHDSWGGGNQFVLQLKTAAERAGWEVRHDLLDPDVVVLIDPRKGGLVKYGPEEIRKAKRKNPRLQVIHRVNECDQRKATHFMDELLREANQIADHTVFISHWLHRYFVDRWFDAVRPSSVIQNGADSQIFCPGERQKRSPEAVLHIVTHHWSNNRMKGFDEYKALDRLIASGSLRDVSLTVIGRWPENVRWEAARTLGPMHGPALAEELRQHDIYITASRWEPCGMHHLEGAQCGLPLLYHQDGGGIVEFGMRYGVGFCDDLKGAVQELKSKFAAMREQVLRNPPSGTRMCEDFMKVVTEISAHAP